MSMPPLKQVLKDYCRGKDIGIKVVMLKEFANDLDTIIKLYNDVPKKIVYKKKKPVDIEDI